jgi:hypothetical protein
MKEEVVLLVPCVKNIYGAHNHISRALKQTNALKNLATDLGKIELY